MALDQCPSDLCASIYVVYGHVEEEHGLARRAMRIYERATHHVPLDRRFDMSS
ncbi:pre-mRNA-splicing factor syf1, partial [Coelomomyces lativittatus]